MIRVVLSLVAALLSFDALAITTYKLVEAVAAPSSYGFQPPCRVGTCTNYGGDTKVSGSFVTSNRLQPNLVGAEIYPNLLGYTFTDGVNTYSSSNPDGRVHSFLVWTSDTGAVITQSIWLVTWTSGPTPHKQGDRINSLTLRGTFVSAHNNDSCLALATSAGPNVNTGVSDTCAFVKPDASSSVAETPVICSNCPGGGQPVWVADTALDVARPVPTLSARALALLVLLMGVAAYSVGLRIKRR